MVKRNIKEFFSLQNQNGKRVGGLGAAAKGNTMLNFLKLSKDEIPYVFDSAPSKHGKFLPGSHIPIFSLESLNEYKDIDLLVVLPWNIAKELSSYVYSFQKIQRPIYRLLPKIEIVPIDTQI
jgi:hypothetical protein